MRRRVPIARWIAPASLVFATGTAAAEEPVSVRVLAAASLTEVVEALAKRFEGARVVTSFGVESALAFLYEASLIGVGRTD
jgi:ABC-type molybdate transport system substrate-binding protein